MPRILAIDYGMKRCGIAVTDELQIIASGLCTVQQKDLFKWLDEYLSKEKVENVVLGLPIGLNNQATNATQAVLDFKVKLERKFPKIKVSTIDERFTSKMAQQSILASGVKKSKRQQKELTDEVSATIILQSYLTRL